MMDTDDLPRQPDQTPKPLSAFPALFRLIEHEPWLRDPDVRAQCTWREEGWGGHDFAFYIIRNGHKPTMGTLIRDDELLEYCRLYPDYSLAALDSALWVREVLVPPDPDLINASGIDASGQTWSVRVVRRQRRWEVHLTQGGLIPLISDFDKYDDASLVAENWLTVFCHADDGD